MHRAGARDPPFTILDSGRRRDSGGDVASTAPKSESATEGSTCHRTRWWAAQKLTKRGFKDGSAIRTPDRRRSRQRKTARMAIELMGMQLKPVIGLARTEWLCCSGLSVAYVEVRPIRIAGRHDRSAGTSRGYTYALKTCFAIADGGRGYSDFHCSNRRM
jgi:hypothetical protein